MSCQSALSTGRPDEQPNNIGLNPFTSDKSIWLAGPDIVGSILLTGKPPKVLRAIRLEPIGFQAGMQPVRLGRGFIDPYTTISSQGHRRTKGKPKSDPLNYFLKILANAGCYGIYAELNRLRLERMRRST